MNSPSNLGNAQEFSDAFDERITIGPGTRRSSILSNKLTGVLSSSYTDSEIRDALRTLDRKGVHNTPEARRRLRSDLQKEVIDCNGGIVKEFGLVAEVGSGRCKIEHTHLC